VQLAEVRLKLLSDKHEQVSLLERIAEKCERELHDVTRALDAMARALKIRPDEAHLADEVERLARAVGHENQAGEVLESVIAQGAPEAVLRDLGMRAARLWLRMSLPDRAEQRFLAVLSQEKDNAEALESLEQIYRGRKDPARLADILERRAEEEFDITGKKKLLAEAANLHAGALADRPRAVQVWKKVLDADEADGEALDALAGLYEADARWPELVEALQAKARFAEDAAAQLALKFRIADLYANQLDDGDKAVEAYRDLLDLAPDSLAALEALEALETKRQDWTAVQEVLVRRLQAVGAGAAQVPVYKKLARLAVDKHQSPDDAIGYLHEVLAIQPEDAQANESLAELLEKTEKWHDLIDIYTEQANRRARGGDKKGEIALLVRAADLWEQKLGSPESATELLERILERDPSSARALMSLARIYESAHDLDKCRATLERAAELASTQEEAAELHYRMGRLEADAHGDEAGEPHYARALDADPKHAEAGRALEQIARARGDWERVAYLLAAREESAPESDKRALWLELSNVYVDKLKQPQAALPYLERAVKAAPDDPQVLEPLADLYLAAGKYNDALPLYRSLVEKVGKGKRTKDVARLNFRIGQIAEKSNQQAQALESYNAAYSIDPTHTGTLEALGRLHMVQNDWEKARKIYRSMLLANLDPQAGITKADVYLHLGEIHEKLGEGPKAVGMYERGLELEANHARLKEALGRVRK
jgi:tetratricopeptide (TPR) repeat protein